MFGGGSGDPITSFVVPMLAVFAIMYFMVIRPQQTRAKRHQEMLKAVRRGDVVVTNGGLVGKVTKVVDDDQVEVEVADGVKVRQVRGMIAEVRTKTEPVRSEPGKDDKGR